MVRLGGAEQLLGITFVLSFQFQYGSIGSETKLAQYPALKVSIPVWFDWESFVASELTGMYEFQFQYGSIGRRFNLREKRNVSRFQFQYGSIGRDFSNHPILIKPSFQFQYGSIGRISLFLF